MTKFITNQNIEIKLELAGLGDRIFAFLIDASIILVYILGIFFLNIFIHTEFSYLNFIFILPVLFYSLLFEIFSNGQTPGKKIREIKVMRLDGGAPGISNFLLRWILRPIDILIYGSVAMISIIVTKNGQRLGDLAAGTTVVKVRSSLSIADVESINKNLNHVVTFNQVKRLNDNQVALIRKALHMRRDGFNTAAAEELAKKIKDYLSIESKLPTTIFLYTILKDYEYFQMQVA